ncbi:hypothetical protein M422DRAFT_245488 [Sphaerobolus stellatus SS14]|nr:hypothetical protein M422DRAFT_245488 [Sphaerobolus stellatus SS14]
MNMPPPPPPHSKSSLHALQSRPQPRPIVRTPNFVIGNPRTPSPLCDLLPVKRTFSAFKSPNISEDDAKRQKCNSGDKSDSDLDSDVEFIERSLADIPYDADEEDVSDGEFVSSAAVAVTTHAPPLPKAGGTDRAANSVHAIQVNDTTSASVNIVPEHMLDSANGVSVTAAACLKTVPLGDQLESSNAVIAPFKIVPENNVESVNNDTDIPMVHASIALEAKGAFDVAGTAADVTKSVAESVSDPANSVTNGTCPIADATMIVDGDADPANAIIDDACPTTNAPMMAPGDEYCWNGPTYSAAMAARVTTPATPAAVRAISLPPSSSPFSTPALPGSLFQHTHTGGRKPLFVLPNCEAASAGRAISLPPSFAVSGPVSGYASPVNRNVHSQFSATSTPSAAIPFNFCFDSPVRPRKVIPLPSSTPSMAVTSGLPGLFDFGSFSPASSPLRNISATNGQGWASSLDDPFTANQTFGANLTNERIPATSLNRSSNYASSRAATSRHGPPPINYVTKPRSMPDMEMWCMNEPPVANDDIDMSHINDVEIPMSGVLYDDRSHCTVSSPSAGSRSEAAAVPHTCQQSQTSTTPTQPPRIPSQYRASTMPSQVQTPKHLTPLQASSLDDKVLGILENLNNCTIPLLEKLEYCITALEAAQDTEVSHPGSAACMDIDDDEVDETHSMRTRKRNRAQSVAKPRKPADRSHTDEENFYNRCIRDIIAYMMIPGPERVEYEDIAMSNTELPVHLLPSQEALMAYKESGLGDPTYDDFSVAWLPVGLGKGVHVKRLRGAFDFWNDQAAGVFAHAFLLCIERNEWGLESDEWEPAWKSIKEIKLRFKDKIRKYNKTL